MGSSPRMLSFPPGDRGLGSEKGQTSPKWERPREITRTPFPEAPLGDSQPSSPLGASVATAKRCPRVFLSPSASCHQGPGQGFSPKSISLSHSRKLSLPHPDSPRTSPPKPVLTEPRPHHTRTHRCACVCIHVHTRPTHMHAHVHTCVHTAQKNSVGSQARKQSQQR